MALRLNDEATLCSLDILAEAVDMVALPGIIELRTLRKALEAARRERTSASLDYAYAAFRNVERDLRDRIVHHALSLAMLRRRTNGGS